MRWSIVLLAGCVSQGMPDRVAGDEVTPTEEVQPDPEPARPEPPDPAEVVEAVEVQENVTCQADADCLAGEVCVDQVCQIERCTQTYSSEPPLGGTFPIRGEQEVVVLAYDWWSGDQHHLSWDVAGTSLPTLGATAAGTDRLLDLSGGHVVDERPEALVLLERDTRVVSVFHATDNRLVTTPFRAGAITTGDVDGQGVEEILTAAADGRWASCHAPTDTCVQGQVGQFTMEDAGAGDVDGDGLAELVLVGDGELAIVHVVPGPGEPDYDVYDISDAEAWRVAVADLEGDGRAEIVTLVSDSLDLFADDVVTWGLSGSRLVRLDTSTPGNNFLVDLDVGDTGATGNARMIGITSDEYARLGTWTGMRWNFSVNRDVDRGWEHDRVALADLDGNGVIGVLGDGPHVMPASVVPLAVLHHGPYDAERSAGVSSVSLGLESGIGSSASEAVSLQLGASVGVTAPLVGAGVSTSVSMTVQRKLKTARSERVRTGYGVDAAPEVFGDHSAAVVLGWGCFHGYDYEVDDPEGFASDPAADNRLRVSIPVGGGTTAWSSHRYDAVVAALGHGTPLDVPHVVGDPSTYPATLDVSPADLLFPEPPELSVSDVASVTWRYALAESTSEEVSQGLALKVDAKVDAPGFQFGASAGVGNTEAYTVSADSLMLFSGRIPPLPDDPATPEDEFLAHRYGVTPWVYLRDLEAPSGESVSVFVVDYTVR